MNEIEKHEENYFNLLELKNEIDGGKYDTIHPLALKRLKSAVNGAYSREVKELKKQLDK